VNAGTRDGVLLFDRPHLAAGPRSKEHAVRVRRLIVPLAATTALACAVGLSASGAATADDDGRDLLRSGLVGSTPAAQGGPTLFGVLPGGAPWVVDHDSSVRVRDGGRVDVKIRGLVIPGRGNPVARVVATVVCNGDVGGTVSTPPADLSPEGDGRIRADVHLPKQCLAPAVLVRVATSGAPGAYIAADGG
jgi:hypothetical protein